MGASITIAGESLIARKHGQGTQLSVERFVLANVPGLDSTEPVDRAAGMPAQELIVHTAAVSQSAYLSPNQVIYSLQLNSDVGDFDFNWIGLETTEGVLLIVAYVPLQQKRREIPPLQTGNNLTRNIMVVFDGAQAMTGIAVPAETWQYDFTGQLGGKLDKAVLAGGTPGHVALASGDDAAPIAWRPAGHIAAAAIHKDEPFVAAVGARYYLASDAAIPTLPPVADLSPGDALAFIKASAATPLIGVDGAADETITHDGQTDTSSWLDIDVEVLFVWNGAGSWEIKL